MTNRPVSIAAGTTNPAKLDAIRQAAAALFGDVRVEPVAVDAGVPDQPWGDEQTADGAITRARQALVVVPADYGLGVESGLVDGPGGRIYVVSWASAVDTFGAVGFGGSERFPVPVQIEPQLRSGAELGPLLDEVTGQTGLALREGAVSIFTGGRRTRSQILAVAILHALLALREPWRPT